jgi:hypothetical protein
MAVTLRTASPSLSSKFYKEKEGETKAPFGTTGIGANDDRVLPARDTSLDVGDHEGLRVEVVDRNIEEALDLACMQVHCDDVVAAGHGEHIGNELGGDGRPALVLFIHTCVGITRNDGSDAAGGCALARGNEDEELHEVVVDVTTGGLEDKDILVADRLENFDVDLPI